MIKIVTGTGNGTAQIRLHDNDLANLKNIGNGTNVTIPLPPSSGNLPALSPALLRILADLCRESHQEADCDSGGQPGPRFSVCMPASPPDAAGLQNSSELIPHLWPE